MAIKFNPLTGNFDFTGSGGGGGGASYIDGEVATYTDLPLDGSAALNTAWLVREASGAWLLARKPAGIYIRTATAGASRDADYTYAGILPDVFNDANFLLYDNGDSTKNLAFQLSSITTGTTRTLTVPNASGTLALAEDFAAPPAIGSTTPAAGTFTTLAANTSLTLNGTGAAELVNAGAAAGPLRIYNTFTSATNHERGFLRWSSNVFQIGTEAGSSGGSARAMQFQIGGTTRLAVGSAVTITGGDNAGVFTINDGGIRVQGNQGFFVFGSGTYSNVSNVVNNWNNNLGVLVRRLSTGTGDFVDFQDSSSVSKLKIDKDGYVVLPTSGGVKIGTGTTQLLGFWNATPAAQPAAVADATDAASTQARLNDLLARLRTIGIIAT
jgi:hypothetical protein